MQEGMGALVQMTKVVAARAELASAHQPLLALLGDPTTGGVLASIAGLADFTGATPRATIGFAGPRVVHRVTGALPAESHTAESAFKNGLIDALDDPEGSWLSLAADALAPDEPGRLGSPPPLMGSLAEVDEWETVVSTRRSARTSGPALLFAIGEVALEMRGDRAGSDDRAVVAALVRVAGRRVIGMALDRALSPGPGAFRKARRALSIAERLDVPVVTLIDTPGADPTPDSERGGLAWEISALTSEMLATRVPILSVITGEGGSGGALAFAAGDLLLAYRSSTFSIIRPEAAAEILWRDSGRAAEAARLLKPSAVNLLRLGIADSIIDARVEPETLRDVVAYHLDLLRSEPMSGEERAQKRHRRWRRGGS
jgi:acetyl-CoA carboxylase alpha subunit